MIYMIYMICMDMYCMYDMYDMLDMLDMYDMLDMLDNNRNRNYYTMYMMKIYLLKCDYFDDKHFPPHFSFKDVNLLHFWFSFYLPIVFQPKKLRIFLN
jgi:hypothetical protein